MLADANLKKEPASFSFDQLNTLMKNMGSEQFDYESFKLAYDSDQRIKPMVKNFDQEGVTLATAAEANAEPQQQAGAKSTVSQMAKRATSSRR